MWIRDSNRVGDAIAVVSRVFLLDPTLHYVDDFGGVDDEKNAQTAFQHFAALNKVLGFNVKTNKAQPQPSHRWCWECSCP